MIPEYLMYKLCGVKAREYTNATTMGMINAETGEFDEEIIRQLGYPVALFPKLSQPGTVIGTYEGIQVVLCAIHDTGSAVEGIPMEGNHPYISSGTWSLLGVKTSKPITDAGSKAANFSNEGGVGYNRYQKNIMGMWLVKEFRLVVWGMHGICGAGKTMDETFGLIETVEKAAQIYMLTAHLPRVNTIRDDQMVELAEFFGVNYRKDFLYL